MKKIMLLSMLFISSLKSEVYDCFTFFNELELLKIRFEELYDVVDHFVLVEAPISFTGKNKPLYFQDNAADFEKYKNKIIHVVIDGFPDLTGDEEKDHWYREAYSRDAILQGLTNCKKDDVIFISDVDEIPKADAVKRITQYLDKKKNAQVDDKKLVCGLEMRLFMYFMNREVTEGWYGGSKATPYWMVCKHSPWGIKLFHHKYSMYKIPDAGWHFNTMGGVDRSFYKWLQTGPIYYEGNEEAILNYYADETLRNEHYESHLRGNPAVRAKIDESFPKSFLDNLDYFREIGWLEE